MTGMVPTALKVLPLSRFSFEFGEFLKLFVGCGSANRQELLRGMDDKKAEFQQAVAKQEQELQGKLHAHRCVCVSMCKEYTYSWLSSCRHHGQGV